MSMINSPASVSAGAGPQRGPQAQVMTPPSGPGQPATPLPQAGGTTTNPNAPTTADARFLFNLIHVYLQDMGLTGLSSLGSTGAPRGWLWDQITSGVNTQEQLMMAVEQTDQWRDRFGVIVAQRERRAKGEAVHVMSVEEVLNYEVATKQLLRAAGLPKWMYNDRSIATQAMLNDISDKELEERLGTVWSRVRNTDPAVLQAFERFYGVGQGGAAMAAYFLDPDRTLAALNEASRTAYTAGMANTMGIGLNKATSQRIAQMPRTESGIVEGLGQVSAMAGAFQRGVFERGNLTAETTGVDAVFDSDADAQRSIERRVERRRASERSSTGGALRTQEGLIGTRTDR